MMTITSMQADMIMDAMAYIAIRLIKGQGFTDEDIEFNREELQNYVRDAFVKFCDLNEIYDIEDEDCYDVPDDVDETNYNPYMGCDDFDCFSAEEGWD